VEADDEETPPGTPSPPSLSPVPGSYYTVGFEPKVPYLCMNCGHINLVRANDGFFWCEFETCDDKFRVIK
jgi:hypothetical protein